jgi:predicted amidohydrolase YtcJ
MDVFFFCIGCTALLIALAMFRLDSNGKPWKPEECLTFEEAMELYTYNAAFAVFKENEIGRIEVGYRADFIVLDCDVHADPTLLPKAKVLEVWVDGKQTFKRQ